MYRDFTKHMGNFLTMVGQDIQKIMPRPKKLDALDAHLTRNGFRRLAEEMESGNSSFFSSSLRRLSNMWFDHRIYSRLNKICMDKIETYAAPEPKEFGDLEICARREWREGGVIAESKMSFSDYLKRSETAELLLDMAGPLDSSDVPSSLNESLYGQGSFKFTWSDGFKVRQPAEKN